MFVFHRKHLGASRPVTGIALLFLYVDDVHTSRETPPRSVTGYPYSSTVTSHVSDKEQQLVPANFPPLTVGLEESTSVTFFMAPVTAF
jgi:hypothetical protein